MIRNGKLISDNRSVSSMSVHRASITTVLPDRYHIPQKNLTKILSEISITGNDSTQEPDNTSKKTKVDSSIDEKRPIDEIETNLKLTPPTYKNKQDYVGVTNDNTREFDGYPCDTDCCARNLDD